MGKLISRVVGGEADSVNEHQRTDAPSDLKRPSGSAPRCSTVLACANYELMILLTIKVLEATKSFQFTCIRPLY